MHRLALALLLTLAVLGGLLGGPHAPPPAAAGETDAGAAFIGPEACAPCHRVNHDAWLASSHRNTFLPATKDALPPGLEDGATIEHPPGRTTIHAATRAGRGVLLARTQGPDGLQHDYELSHVVGRVRIQMYLATMDDGRHQVLPFMRELPDGPYFDYTHLIFGTGAQDPLEVPLVPPGHPSFWTGPVRDFDARCSRCHVSGRAVEPPTATGTRGRTTWRAEGVDCESCHGPGSAHADHHGGAGGSDPLLSYRALDRDRAVGVCLGCHMEAEVVDPDFRPGEDVLEHVNPTLLDDLERVDAFGRPLELIYDGLPFLASRCAEEGQLTCVTCHDPHGSEHGGQMTVDAADPALCSACHARQTDAPEAHAHHAAGTPGGRCVDCHMPRLTIERGHGAVADHTIGVPRIDPPGERAATDACTWCHDGRLQAPAGAPRLGKARLVEAYARWWPDAAPPAPWAEAVANARAGGPEARGALERVLLDEAAPRVYRATAARLLGRQGRDALPALLLFAADPDSLVRREVMTAIGAVGGTTKAAETALLEGLADPSAAVRGRAARAALEGWERVRASPSLLKAVLPALEAEARAVPDDDLRWFRLGAARETAGDIQGAVEAYARQVALDPFATNVARHLEELRARLK